MKQNNHELFHISTNLSKFTSNQARQLPNYDINKNHQNLNSLNTQNSSAKMINSQILMPQIIESYQLNSNLLLHTQIQEIHRAKLHLWISQNCHIRGLSQQTSSLACYILDLYFSKGNKCTIEQFHEYGICCLRIANKIEENMIIPINYDVFNADKLLNIETQICMKINFFLNPITFTQICQNLNYLWSQFKQTISKQGFNANNLILNYLKYQDKVKIIGMDYSYGLLHQFMELVNLILESHSFQIDKLVSNSFYLIFCVQFSNWQNIISSSKLQNFINQNQNFSLIWKSFETFCEDYSNKFRVEIDERYLEYLYPIYNCLISQNKSKSSDKSNEVLFNPGDQKFKLKQGKGVQTLYFKDKKGSLRKYMRSKISSKHRKSSQLTNL